MTDDTDAKPDLSTATTRELLEELDHRCDAYVLAAIFKGQQRGPDSCVASVWYNGNIYAAIGLAEQVRHDLVTRRIFTNGQSEAQPDDSE